MSNQRPRVPIDTLPGYDAWAATYDHDANPTVAMAERAMASWVPAARLAGRAVVELGCGTGRNAAAVLAGGAARYLGIDGSAGMLERARASTSDPRVTWRHTDIAAPPPDLTGFDVVFFSLVLEHFVELGPAFESGARLAPKDATLALFELHPDVHARGARAHFRGDGDGASDQDFALPSFAHDETEIARALEAAGWSVASATSWYVTPNAVAACPKLAKHAGARMLLSMTAHR